MGECQLRSRGDLCSGVPARSELINARSYAHTHFAIGLSVNVDLNLDLPGLAQGDSPDTDIRDVIAECIERPAIELKLCASSGSMKEFDNVLLSDPVPFSGPPYFFRDTLPLLRVGTAGGG